MVSTVSESVTDTVATLRNKSQMWRERVTGDSSDDD
jgi:hypothetical protein